MISVLAFVAMLSSAPALVDLGTVGPTVPAAPYYQRIAVTGPQPQRVTTSQPIPPRWPLQSALLTPGPVDPAPLPAAALFNPPVFVVGTDQRSLAWLQRRGPQLRESGAIGYVVAVPDQAAWERLRAAAGGLPLYPMPGDALAQALGLRHYPALLSHRGIEP